LLYLGDVPVESTYHGSALLFRLLQGYPADRLCIVERRAAESQGARRLPAVRYESVGLGSGRLQNTRLHRWNALWSSLASEVATRRAMAVAAPFQPDAVLTVAHGHLWVTAAAFARRLRVPLHVIVHDDWSRIARPPWPFRHLVEAQFRRVYCQAATRFCVSPFMVEEYQRRYGADGVLLYPSRAPEAVVSCQPAERLTGSGKGLVYAFAGTINAPGYARLLSQLANRLASGSGKLLIYGPITPAAAKAAGLDSPNLEVRGLLQSGELMRRLREEADVLFVPMSFAEADRANMEISFPSKLTDYTAIGLPLLIWGPAYCSAVRWARENPGVAEVVESSDETAIVPALDRLAHDPGHRISLARCALSAADRYFSHEAADAIFRAGLCLPGRTRPIPRIDSPTEVRL
jgi:hypothetical protein